jgi:hypothetical protein
MAWSAESGCCHGANELVLEATSVFRLNLSTSEMIKTITSRDMPSQSRCVALEGSHILTRAQAIMPPINPNVIGSSHHAQEVRSTGIASLLSLGIAAPHSGQYSA